MFEEDGSMRISKSKSKLKTLLEVKVPSRTTSLYTYVIDGCAFLWVVSWPSKGATVSEFCDVFKSQLLHYLKFGNVYLVFDRYEAISIKHHTRQIREKGYSRQFNLSLDTVLPTKEVVLNNSANKKKLIELLIVSITSDTNYCCQLPNSIVVTGQNPVPIEVSSDGNKERTDLINHQEEADVIMIQQVFLASSNASFIKVFCDDTDVFVLLVHLYASKNLYPLRLHMQSPKVVRQATDIGETVKSIEINHHVDPQQLLPFHAITGCDTVACFFNLGKQRCFNSFKQGFKFKFLAKIDSDIMEVVKECTEFISTVYGHKSSSLTTARQAAWHKKAGNSSLLLAPKLHSLPPTTATFIENVKRAHLQSVIWSHALSPS